MQSRSKSDQVHLPPGVPGQPATLRLSPLQGLRSSGRDFRPVLSSCVCRRRSVPPHGTQRKLAHTFTDSRAVHLQGYISKEEQAIVQSLTESKGRPHLEVIAASWGPAVFAASHRLTTGHWCQLRSLLDLSVPGRKLPAILKSHYKKRLESGWSSVPVFCFHGGGSQERGSHLQPLGSSQIPRNRPGWGCPIWVGPGPRPPEAHSLLRDTTSSKWPPRRILLEVYLC